IFGTIHTKAFNHMTNTEKNGTAYAKDLETNFHVYGIDWHKDRLVFRFNGTPYFTFKKPKKATVEEWPFDQPFYLLLNVAVGGNWGGVRGVDESIWPQRMEIDWVRVSKL
ncbi:MAG: glycoside hydrolase family 16 protein, partial [Bacteroidota bacterium]